MAIALVASGGLTVKKACKSRMVLPVSTWHRGRSRRYEGDQRYRAVAILIDRTLVWKNHAPRANSDLQNLLGFWTSVSCEDRASSAVGAWEYPRRNVYDEPSTEVVREMPGRLGQQTDAYASHPNGAGVSSAA